MFIKEKKRNTCRNVVVDIPTEGKRETWCVKPFSVMHNTRLLPRFSGALMLIKARILRQMKNIGSRISDSPAAVSGDSADTTGIVILTTVPAVPDGYRRPEYGLVPWCRDP